MIPTLLLVGLVIGLFVRDQDSLLSGSLFVVIAALLWGLGVGVANGSVSTFFSGATFALANLFVGSAISASLRNGWRLVASNPPTETE